MSYTKSVQRVTNKVKGVFMSDHTFQSGYPDPENADPLIDCAFLDTSYIC